MINRMALAQNQPGPVYSFYIQRSFPTDLPAKFMRIIEDFCTKMYSKIQ